MHLVLQDHLDNGWIQLFCLDQPHEENWGNEAVGAGHRAWTHIQYYRYVQDEVLPYSAWLNPNPFVIATGASLGASHAVTFGLKYPGSVGRILGMSGLYDITRMTGGYSDDNVYAVNPMDFMQHEHDPARLDAFRRQDIDPRDRSRRSDVSEQCRVLGAAVEPGHRQRAPGVGRECTRLAVLGADGADLPAGARLAGGRRAIGRLGDRAASRSHHHTSGAGMTKRVGLLVGREWSFPPAFIEEVNRRDAGVVAEFVTLGGVAMDEPCPYDVIVDRISHEVPYYRTYLKHAVLEGVAVVNNPFMWTADDKFFGAALVTKLGVASPKTVVLPNKEYVPGIVPTESLRNLQPLDWEGLVAEHRPAVHPQGRARRRLEGRLRLPHAGGADHALRQSGLLTMIVQEFIEWEQFVRCMCLGQEEILVMQYDPEAAPLHRRPGLPRAGAPGAGGARLPHDRAGAGLRHELGRVGDPRRHAVRDRLHEPGAGHGHQLADAGLLRVGGHAHGRHGDPARQGRPAAGDGIGMGGHVCLEHEAVALDRFRACEIPRHARRPGTIGTELGTA